MNNPAWKLFIFTDSLPAIMIYSKQAGGTKHEELVGKVT